MAVVKIGTTIEYLGESADAKPEGAPVGSKFYEWDTKKRYICTPSGWVEYGPDTAWG